jgi:hypothetical protein
LPPFLHIHHAGVAAAASAASAASAAAAAAAAAAAEAAKRASSILAVPITIQHASLKRGAASALEGDSGKKSKVGSMTPSAANDEDDDDDETSVVYPCHQCDQIFPDRSSLNIHERIHTSTGKLHKCEICHKTFNQVLTTSVFYVILLFLFFICLLISLFVSFLYLFYYLYTCVVELTNRRAT